MDSKEVNSYEYFISKAKRYFKTFIISLTNRKLTLFIISQHNYELNGMISATILYFLSLVWKLPVLGFLVNYFQFIIKQIEGFINPITWIALGVFITILSLTVIMRYEVLVRDSSLLEFYPYIIFLIWAQATAPSEPEKLPVTGSKFINLAASLIMGYSIHDSVVQILLRTITKSNFGRVVKMVYVAGTLILDFSHMQLLLLEIESQGRINLKQLENTFQMEVDFMQD